MNREPRRRRITWRGVFAIFVFTALPLFYFGEGAYDLYGYYAGTPTTATVTSCRAPHSRRTGFSERYCTGTWSVGGESHTGRIMGPRDGFDRNQSVDVRVRGDTAFTAAAARWHFVAGAIATGVIGVPILLLLWFGKSPRRGSSKSRRDG